MPGNGGKISSRCSGSSRKTAPNKKATKYPNESAFGRYGRFGKANLACSRAELLVAVIAGLLEGCRHVVVGASSPIPGAAALLRRELTEGAMRVTILGSNRYNDFTNGGVETFDMAAQGRIDAFFLGGGQIDGQGNINLVGTGTYPANDVRWPGSFGSAYLYYLVPSWS
jgi:glutaconate CoA-transferase subunit B